MGCIKQWLSMRLLRVGNVKDNDLKRFLKCFYVIKNYEESEDYSLVEADGFNIDEYLSFLKDIGRGLRCSTRGDDFYCMGLVLNELIVRAKRIVEKKLSSNDRKVDFVYEYNKLEKIVVKSKDYKDVIELIVDNFDKSVELVFNEGE